MDEEIKQLQARIQELEQKKREEEERNKDPFRYLRQRIEDRTNELFTYEPSKNGHREAIRITTRELECDKCIIQTIEKLQADLELLREEFRNQQEVVQRQLEALRSVPVGNLLG